MANLRAQSVTALQNADRIELLGYYAANDGGGGEFIWKSTDSRSDDGGVIIKPTAVSGNGRLNRLVGGMSDPYLHSSWYGVKADNSTDNSVQLQALINASISLGINAVYIDPCPNTSINFGTQITLAPNIVIRGAGKNVSVLKFTNASNTTFAFSYFAPVGLSSGLKAPQFLDLALNCLSGIQINNPNGGFTDDGTSQQALTSAFIQRCSIYSTSPNTAGTIGIRMSKVSEGVIQDCEITGFGIHVDLEGSENCRIRDNRMVGAVSEFILVNSHGTFGNSLVVDGNFMAEMVNGGNAYVVSSYRTVAITNNWVEGGGNYTAVWWLQQSQSAVAVIRDNFVSMQPAAVTNALKVDDTTDGNGGGAGTGYLLIDYRNNQGADLSGSHGVANFNGNTRISYYSGPGAARRKLVHSGNYASFGDIGFPCNSRSSSLDGQNLGPNLVAYFSPNDDGLNFNGLGVTVKCLNGAFQLTSTGSSNYLDFSNTEKPTPTGTLKLYVLAAPASGGVIRAAVTDAGSVVGSFAAQALTTKPAWYLMNGGAVVGNSGGCRVYSDASDVKLYAAVLGT